MVLRRWWLACSWLLACAGSTPPRAPEPLPSPPALPWEAQPPVVVEVESPSTVLVGATVLTGAGASIEDGVVVFDDGRIRAVGSRNEVGAPAGARQLDVTGKFVTPGLIDSHSHMGVYAVPHVAAHSDGNEATRPITAQMRAADSFWPQDPALSRALAAGVTTALVLPGSANLVGGQGITLKLVPGRGASEMAFPGAPATLKMACGENPKRVYGERRSAPSTRMGNLAGYRDAFQAALEYKARFVDWQVRHQSWQRKAAKRPSELEPAPSMPARDWNHEALLAALEGRSLVQVHCYRADDMLAMLALAREFGLTVRAFHHAVEAYKIRDVLRARGVGVATWADWWGFKMEAYDAVRENLALLAESGVRAALHSDSSSLVQRLNQEAAKALRAGKRAGIALDRDDALAWITLNPAWALGVHEQTGSLEPGKMADVVVWSGDPLSVYSTVERVFIDGHEVYDAARGPWRSDFELGHGDLGPPAPGGRSEVRP